MEGLFRLRPERLHQLIATKQLKKWWVAEFTGVHKTTLRRWLSGKITRVKGSHLVKLASTLDADASWIAEFLRPE